MRFPIKITDNFLLEPLLHTFGVRRETTFVELDADSITVSMGRWFHERIPLDQIAAVAPSSWPWWGGLGVKLHHHGIGVVGSTEGIVNLEFKVPLKMHALVIMEVKQLWLSLEDSDGFLRALSAACRLPVSEPTKF
jgi:hypothetical protein